MGGKLFHNGIILSKKPISQLQILNTPNAFSPSIIRYNSIFKPDAQPFVAEAIADLKEKDMDQFLYMVRCLHELRLEAKPRTQMARDFDMTENKRL